MRKGLGKVRIHSLQGIFISPWGLLHRTGRTCVLGKVPRQSQDEFAFALKARQFSVDLLQLGAPINTGKKLLRFKSIIKDDIL